MLKRLQKEVIGLKQQLSLMKEGQYQLEELKLLEQEKQQVI